MKVNGIYLLSLCLPISFCFGQVTTLAELQTAFTDRETAPPIQTETITVQAGLKISGDFSTHTFASANTLNIVGGLGATFDIDQADGPQDPAVIIFIGTPIPSTPLFDISGIGFSAPTSNKNPIFINFNGLTTQTFTLGSPLILGQSTPDEVLIAAGRYMVSNGTLEPTFSIGDSNIIISIEESTPLFNVASNAPTPSIDRIFVENNLGANVQSALIINGSEYIAKSDLSSVDSRLGLASSLQTTVIEIDAKARLSVGSVLNQTNNIVRIPVISGNVSNGFLPIVDVSGGAVILGMGNTLPTATATFSGGIIGEGDVIVDGNQNFDFSANTFSPFQGEFVINSGTFTITGNLPPETIIVPLGGTPTFPSPLFTGVIADSEKYGSASGTFDLSNTEVVLSLPGSSNFTFSGLYSGSNPSQGSLKIFNSDPSATTISTYTLTNTANSFPNDEVVVGDFVTLIGVVDGNLSSIQNVIFAGEGALTLNSMNNGIYTGTLDNTTGGFQATLYLNGNDGLKISGDSSTSFNGDVVISSGILIAPISAGIPTLLSTGSGSVILENSTTLVVTPPASGSGPFVLSNVINDSDNANDFGSVVFKGNDTFSFGNPQLYKGTTTIDGGGVFSVTYDATLSPTVGLGEIIVSAQSTVQLNVANFPSGGAVSINNDILLDSTATAVLEVGSALETLSFKGKITGQTTSHIDVDGGTGKLNLTDLDTADFEGTLNIKRGAVEVELPSASSIFLNATITATNGVPSDGSLSITTASSSGGVSATFSPKIEDFEAALKVNLTSAEDSVTFTKLVDLSSSVEQSTIGSNVVSNSQIPTVAFDSDIYGSTTSPIEARNIGINFNDVSSLSASFENDAVSFIQFNSGGTYGGVISSSIANSTTPDVKVNLMASDTITFTNNNVYVGTTEVISGTLAIDYASSAIPLPGNTGVKVSEGAILELKNTQPIGTITLSNIVSGEGGVKYTTAQEFVANVQNTYTGGTDITNGTVNTVYDEATSVTTPLGSGDVRITTTGLLIEDFNGVTSSPFIVENNYSVSSTTPDAWTIDGGSNTNSIEFSGQISGDNGSIKILSTSLLPVIFSGTTSSSYTGNVSVDGASCDIIISDSGVTPLKSAVFSTSNAGLINIGTNAGSASGVTASIDHSYTLRNSTGSSLKIATHKEDDKVTFNGIIIDGGFPLNIIGPTAAGISPSTVILNNPDSEFTGDISVANTVLKIEKAPKYLSNVILDQNSTLSIDEAGVYGVIISGDGSLRVDLNQDDIVNVTGISTYTGITEVVSGTLLGQFTANDTLFGANSINVSEVGSLHIEYDNTTQDLDFSYPITSEGGGVTFNATLDSTINVSGALSGDNITVTGFGSVKFIQGAVSLDDLSIESGIVSVFGSDTTRDTNISIGVLGTLIIDNSVNTAIVGSITDGVDGTAGTVELSGEFRLEPTQDVSFSGSFSGTGNITFNGDGTYSLTGDSTPFTGDVTINSGIVSNNGSFNDASTLTVNSSGTYKGNGFAGNVVVGSNGTIIPGNSIGTMTVASLNLGAGSISTMEINDAPASDLIVSTNGITIDPSASLIISVLGDGNFRNGETFTLYNDIAGAINGQFGSLTFEKGLSQAFLSGDIIYNTNDIQLIIEVSPGFLQTKAALFLPAFSKKIVETASIAVQHTLQDHIATRLFKDATDLKSFVYNRYNGGYGSFDISNEDVSPANYGIRSATIGGFVPLTNDDSYGWEYTYLSGSAHEDEPSQIDIRSDVHVICGYNSFNIGNGFSFENTAMAAFLKHETRRTNFGVERLHGSTTGIALDSSYQFTYAKKLPIVSIASHARLEYTYSMTREFEETGDELATLTVAKDSVNDWNLNFGFGLLQHFEYDLFSILPKVYAEYAVRLNSSPRNISTSLSHAPVNATVVEILGSAPHVGRLGGSLTAQAKSARVSVDIFSEFHKQGSGLMQFEITAGLDF